MKISKAKALRYADSDGDSLAYSDEESSILSDHSIQSSRNNSVDFYSSYMSSNPNNNAYSNNKQSNHRSNTTNSSEISTNAENKHPSSQELLQLLEKTAKQASLPPMGPSSGQSSFPALTTSHKSSTSSSTITALPHIKNKLNSGSAVSISSESSGQTLKYNISSEFSSLEAYKEAERSYLSGKGLKTPALDQLLIKIGNAMNHSKDYTIKNKQFVFSRNSQPYYMTSIEIRQFMLENLNLSLTNDEMNLLTEKFCQNNWSMDLGVVLATSRLVADKLSAKLYNMKQNKKKKEDFEQLKLRRETSKEKIIEMTDEGNFMEKIMIQLSKSAYKCLEDHNSYNYLKRIPAMINYREMKQLFDHLEIDLSVREYKLLQSKYSTGVNLVDFNQFRADFLQLGKDMKNHLQKLKMEDNYQKMLQNDPGAATSAKEQEFLRVRQGIDPSIEKSKILEDFLRAKKSNPRDKTKKSNTNNLSNSTTPQASNKPRTGPSSIGTIFEDDYEQYDHFNPSLGL